MMYFVPNKNDSFFCNEQQSSVGISFQSFLNLFMKYTERLVDPNISDEQREFFYALCEKALDEEKEVKTAVLRNQVLTMEAPYF